MRLKENLALEMNLRNLEKELEIKTLDLQKLYHHKEDLARYLHTEHKQQNDTIDYLKGELALKKEQAKTYLELLNMQKVD